MEILANYKQLESYMRDAYLSSDRPLLIDKYLGNAMELDVDAVCDGEDVLIGAIMEHLEEQEFIPGTPLASSHHKTCPMRFWNR